MTYISSSDNRIYKELKKLSSSSSVRKEKKLCFCEGDTLYKDALISKAMVKAVFFREKQTAEIPEGCDAYILAEKLFCSAALVETPQNVIFLCEPREEKLEINNGVILLDGVADPGNVGTIIRSADAFGVSVVAGRNCVDIYSPKVIRSAMGAVFRTNIIRRSLSEVIPELIDSGIGVYAATVGENSRRLHELSLSGAAVVIGNEANGVSEEIKALCGREVLIPMEASCESLNASIAASIIMWEMYKKGSLI